MWLVTESVGHFIWKNRGKMTIAVAVGIGAAVYYHYNSQTTPKLQQNNESNQHGIVLEANGSLSTSSREKSRLLYRARKQFDMVCLQFLGTLRGRINDVVDVASAIRQIKELRAAASSPDASKVASPISGGITDSEAEMKVWEDIKIGSFTQLFVTAYAVSAICVLLRVQMHVLARSSDSFTHIQPDTLPKEASRRMKSNDADIHDNRDPNIMSSDCNTAAVVASEPVNMPSHDDSFKHLIDGTYKHIFSTGLRTLSSIVRQQVAYDLRDWKIKEKATVEYGELVQVLSQIRRSIESDVSNLIKIMIIPPEAMDIDVDQSSYETPFASAMLSTSNQYTSSTSDMKKASYTDHTSSSQPFDTNAILAQVWDITESPMFATSFIEVTDACFRIIFDQLRSNIFASDQHHNHHQAGNDHHKSWTPMRTPPLGSILPHVKAIALLLVPTNNQQLSVNVSDLVSGPILDSLCLSVFDASPHK